MAQTFKPTPLPNSATMREVKVWRRQFDAYYSKLGANTWPAVERHALFFGQVDTDISSAIERMSTYGETNSVFPAAVADGTSLNELLEKHLEGVNPVFNRRAEWYKMTQGEGDDAAEHWKRMWEYGLLASVNTMSFEETVIQRCISSLTEPAAIDAVNNLEGNPSFQDYVNRLERLRLAKKMKASTQTTQKPKAKAAAAPTSGQKNNRPRGQGPRKKPSFAAYMSALVCSTTALRRSLTPSKSRRPRRPARQPQRPGRRPTRWPRRPRR